MWDASSEKLRSPVGVYRGLGITRIGAHGPQTSGLPVTGKYSVVHTSAPRKTWKDADSLGVVLKTTDTSMTTQSITEEMKSCGLIQS